MSKNPKLYIYSSNIGFYLVKRNFWNKKWKSLELETKKFDIFLNKYKKLIIKLIAKYMASNWTEDKIDIWFFSPIFQYPSLSGPILIKLRKDFKFTTYILIHELIHYFFTHSNKYKNFKPSFNAVYNVDVLDDFIAYKIFRRKN